MANEVLKFDTQINFTGFDFGLSQLDSKWEAAKRKLESKGILAKLDLSSIDLNFNELVNKLSQKVLYIKAKLDTSEIEGQISNLQGRKLSFNNNTSQVPYTSQIPQIQPLANLLANSMNPNRSGSMPMLPAFTNAMSGVAGGGIGAAVLGGSIAGDIIGGLVTGGVISSTQAAQSSQSAQAIINAIKINTPLNPNTVNAPLNNINFQPLPATPIGTFAANAGIFNAANLANNVINGSNPFAASTANSLYQANPFAAVAAAALNPQNPFAAPMAAEALNLISRFNQTHPKFLQRGPYGPVASTSIMMDKNAYSTKNSYGEEEEDEPRQAGTGVRSGHRTGFVDFSAFGAAALKMITPSGGFQQYYSNLLGIKNNFVGVGSGVGIFGGQNLIKTGATNALMSQGFSAEAAGFLVEAGAGATIGTVIASSAGKLANSQINYETNMAGGRLSQNPFAYDNAAIQRSYQIGGMLPLIGTPAATLADYFKGSTVKQAEQSAQFQHDILYNQMSRGLFASTATSDASLMAVRNNFYSQREAININEAGQIVQAKGPYQDQIAIAREKVNQIFGDYKNKKLTPQLQKEVDNLKSDINEQTNMMNASVQNVKNVAQSQQEQINYQQQSLVASQPYILANMQLTGRNNPLATIQNILGGQAAWRATQMKNGIHTEEDWKSNPNSQWNLESQRTQGAVNQQTYLANQQATLGLYGAAAQNQQLFAQSQVALGGGWNAQISALEANRMIYQSQYGQVAAQNQGYSPWSIMNRIAAKATQFGQNNLNDANIQRNNMDKWYATNSLKLNANIEGYQATNQTKAAAEEQYSLWYADQIKGHENDSDWIEQNVKPAARQKHFSTVDLPNAMQHAEINLGIESIKGSNRAQEYANKWYYQSGQIEQNISSGEIDIRQAEIDLRGPEYNNERKAKIKAIEDRVKLQDAGILNNYKYGGRAQADSSYIMHGDYSNIKWSDLQSAKHLDQTREGRLKSSEKEMPVDSSKSGGLTNQQGQSIINWLEKIWQNIGTAQ